MTVSMADVSTRLNFSSEQEAEKYIRDMVRREQALKHMSTTTPCIDETLPIVRYCYTFIDSSLL